MKGWSANLGSFLISLALLALAGLLWLRPPSAQADIEAMQIGWAVDNLTWIEQAGTWRAALAVKAVDIRRDADVGREVLLQALCAAVMASRMPPGGDYDPQAVYRVDLELFSVSGDRLMAEHALPVPVWDGLCHSPGEAVQIVYGGDLAGWQLNVVDPELASDGTPAGSVALTFRALPDANVEAQSFDPTLACEAVLLDAIVAANLNRFVPIEQVAPEDELDPALMAFFRRVRDTALSLVPGGAWGLRRDVIRAGDPMAEPVIMADTMLVVADDGAAREAWELTVDGAACALVEDVPT